MSSPPRPGLITTMEKNIERMEVQVERPVVLRPWWERIILPLSGLVLVVFGLVFLFTPIPLAILMVFGFPLLFCFHPRIELWARKRMLGALERIRRVLPRLRRWRDHD